jgi:hypothetical protein
MKIGTKVIVREEGAFFGEEGVIQSRARQDIKGPGFDISVPEIHQKAVVMIMGGGLGIFVSESDLEVVS